MWLWTHKPITAQIMDGCRLKHLKNGDPVNDAIGEQNPWRQCIHFQFSPFLVVQNFPWAWLLIIGNIPHCWFYYPSRWIESTSKMQQEGRETVPCICNRSFISSFVRVWDAKLISRATVAFIVCSLYAQATAQYKSQPGVNQLEWGEKYDGVDNALAEQKFYDPGSFTHSSTNNLDIRGNLKTTGQKDKNQNKEIKQQQHIRKR